MSKRIPPKGTPGYSVYWADTYRIRDLKQAADAWLPLANSETDPRRKEVYLSVVGYYQAAHDKMRELWEQTDYFALNEKGTSP